MTKLRLTCRHCHAPLIYVPGDGLTLHYRCAEHGAVILRPLVAVEADDLLPVQRSLQLRSNDAA